MKEYFDIVDKFHRLCLDLQTIMNTNGDIVNEADKSFSDIYHLCELDYPTSPKKRTKVCRLMQEYSVRRRKAKDVISVLEPLQELLTNNPNFVNALGKCKGGMGKALQKAEGERHYNPRVLKELFDV